jgi:hypothetical protein
MPSTMSQVALVTQTLPPTRLLQTLEPRQKVAVSLAQLPLKAAPVLQISPGVVQTPDKQLVELRWQPELPMGTLQNPPWHTPEGLR